MFKALPFAAIVFSALMTAIGLLPLNSNLGRALDTLGRNLISVGANVAQIIQLPITVPVYLIGPYNSLATVENIALHDRALWTVTIVTWAFLLHVLLAEPGNSDA